MTTIRFFLDENQSNDLADALRHIGIDAVTAAEANRRGAADSEHIAWAMEVGRVIVTYDKDYLVLGWTVEHAGIVWFRRHKYRTAGLLRVLSALHKAESMESMRNQVRYP